MWKSKCNLTFCAILGRLRGPNSRGVRISLLLCEIEWDELSREGHQYLAATRNVEYSFQSLEVYSNMQIFHIWKTHTEFWN